MGGVIGNKDIICTVIHVNHVIQWSLCLCLCDHQNPDHVSCRRNISNAAIWPLRHATLVNIGTAGELHAVIMFN